MGFMYKGSKLILVLSALFIFPVAVLLLIINLRFVKK
jgi:hypothetical protein